MPYNGRYCSGYGSDTRHMLPRQCTHLCLQSANCKAYNYNSTDGKCTRFKSPCPQVSIDSVMKFVVFREKPADQCLKWEPYNLGDIINARMIFTDHPKLLICRMQREGSDVVGYFHTIYKTCYASLGNGIYSNTHSYSFQRLRIMEGCTIAWMPYTARDPVHPGAVGAGHMGTGDVVYVTKFDCCSQSGISIAGHYVEGADYTIGAFDRFSPKSTTMMMMVVL